VIGGWRSQRTSTSATVVSIIVLSLRLHEVESRGKAFVSRGSGGSGLAAGGAIVKDGGGGTSGRPLPLPQADAVTPLPIKMERHAVQGDFIDSV
jgi:hypothetical protein